MFKQISTEYILGNILYYKPQGITFSELNTFERRIYGYDNSFIIDISRSAIISAMETCDEYFKMENESLFLKDYYLDKMSRIRNRFVDVLDENTRRAIIAGLLLD